MRRFVRPSQVGVQRQVPVLRPSLRAVVMETGRSHSGTGHRLRLGTLRPHATQKVFKKEKFYIYFNYFISVNIIFFYQRNSLVVMIQKLKVFFLIQL